MRTFKEAVANITDNYIRCTEHDHRENLLAAILRLAKCRENDHDDNPVPEETRALVQAHQMMLVDALRRSLQKDR